MWQENRVAALISSSVLQILPNWAIVVTDHSRSHLILEHLHKLPSSNEIITGGSVEISNLVDISVVRIMILVSCFKDLQYL